MGYKCPECDGEFDEPDNVTKTTFTFNRGFVKCDAKGCPWCGNTLNNTGENPRKPEWLDQ